jgi:hypothetical protein
MHWNVASLPTGTVRLVMGSANSGWYATPTKRKNKTTQYQHYSLSTYGIETLTNTHVSDAVISSLLSLLKK